MSLGSCDGLRMRFVKIRRWAFNKILVECMGNTLDNWGYTGWHPVKSAGKVVLGFERVRQDMIVLRPVVWCDLRTSIFQDKSPSLLEEVQSPI